MPLSIFVPSACTLFAQIGDGLFLDAGRVLNTILSAMAELFLIVSQSLQTTPLILSLALRMAA